MSPQRNEESDESAVGGVAEWVLETLESAQKARKGHHQPLPAGYNEDAQFAMWLKATIGPHAGESTWATCRSCGRTIVGSWFWWTDGLLLSGEPRPYPEPGCHPNRQGVCSVLLGMEEK